jgi:hypothetical protein
MGSRSRDCGNSDMAIGKYYSKRVKIARFPAFYRKMDFLRIPGREEDREIERFPPQARETRYDKKARNTNAKSDERIPYTGVGLAKPQNNVLRNKPSDRPIRNTCNETDRKGRGTCDNRAFEASLNNTIVHYLPFFCVSIITKLPGEKRIEAL